MADNAWLRAEAEVDRLRAENKRLRDDLAQAADRVAPLHTRLEKCERERAWLRELRDTQRQALLQLMNVAKGWEWVLGLDATAEPAAAQPADDSASGG